MPIEASEYTVRYPIKVVGDEIPKDERPQALPGQRQRTHETKVVSSGTVTLSEEDAAPLLDAGAIVPAGADPSLSHDPALVGYEGAGTSADGLGAGSAGGTSNSATGADASMVEVLGEGPATALAERDITTLELAQAATDEELDAIPGVGTKTIERIRALNQG